jgi:hypothetical protein
MEIVKLAMALVPVSLLLCGSVVLFRTTHSIWVSFQLLGSMFLVSLFQPTYAKNSVFSLGYGGGRKAASVITSISEVLCLV